MAKNYIQPGHTITVAAPTGGVLSGDGVLIGTLFGIAQYDAVEGAEVEILTEGVVEIGKTSALQIDVGDRLFWDATNKVVNKTATAQVCSRRRCLGGRQPERHGEDADPRGAAGRHVTLGLSILITLVEPRARGAR